MFACKPLELSIGNRPPLVNTRVEISAYNLLLSETIFQKHLFTCISLLDYMFNLPKFKLPEFKYTSKFYIGAVMVISSFLLAKLVLATFIIYFDRPFIRWLSIIVYVLTWPMLFIGAWWVGKEYAKALHRYFSYQFYHQSLKEGTKKAYIKTKEAHSAVKKKLIEKAYQRTQKKQSI